MEMNNTKKNSINLTIITASIRITFPGVFKLMRRILSVMCRHYVEALKCLQYYLAWVFD